MLGMTRIRKGRRLLAGIGISALLLAACGGDDPADDAGSTDEQPDEAESSDEAGDDGGASGEQVEIVLQTHVTPNLTPEFWADAVERFESENPDVTVETISAPDTDATAYLRTLLASDSLPDVMMNFAVQEFVEADALRPFEIDEDIERIRDYEQHFMDGELYHLPVELQPINLVFYNKDLFAEAGIDEAPSTMDELEQVNQQLQDAGIAPFVMVGEWIPGYVYGTWTLGTLMQDSPLFWEDYAAGEVGFDSEPWTSMASTFQEWADEGVFNTDDFGEGYVQGEQLFLNGEAAMYPMGIWFTAAAPQADFEVGVFPMPTEGEEEVLVANIGSLSPGVAASTENPDAATRLAKFLVFDETVGPDLLESDGLLSNLTPALSYEMTELQQEILAMTEELAIYPSMNGVGELRPPSGAVDRVNDAIVSIMLGNDVSSTLADVDAELAD